MLTDCTILDHLDADLGQDEPWFREPPDDDPTPENKRQARFLSRAATLCPAVDIIAIPNAGKRSDWERLERWREGARAGSLDLVITWQPRGVYFAEFKDAKKGPTPAQRDRLNRLYRMGHWCGLHRTAETLIERLREAGAPFLA